MSELAVRKLSYLLTNEIKPNPRNPRRHTRAQVRAIASSIQAFGFNAPILVDRHGQAIAGHGRLEAAKLLGLERVPVIRLEDLSDAQAKAYMLADNKLTDTSDWDAPVLALHLKELSELSLDFELEATGFASPEIDLLIQSLTEGEAADSSDEFSISEEPATSRPGDLWLLGEHRLLCGSALDAAAYEFLLDGESAAAIFTDPPYNVKIAGNVSGLGRKKHREFAMASGEMAEEEFRSFLSNAFGAGRPHLRPGGLVYACMDWRHAGEMLVAGKNSGFQLLNMCVWVKTNGGMGSFYRSQHELVFVFRNGSESHRNNVQLGRFGRNRTNVWTYPGANVRPSKGKVNPLELHPTVKPIALVADAILDSTAHGEVVVDPFMGSGSTILAAERTGRRGRGIELEPLYVDTTIKRWERLTGKSALLKSGETFAAVSIQRNIEP